MHSFHMFSWWGFCANAIQTAGLNLASVCLCECVVTAKGSEGEGLNGERAREIEADRVHICFGSRECSDGFLCQHHPSGAELNCGTKSEKREAVHRGEQDEAYI